MTTVSREEFMTSVAEQTRSPEEYARGNWLFGPI